MAALLILAGCITGWVSGCGVPEDQTFQPIAPSEVPFGLANPVASSTTTTSTTSTVPPTTTTVPASTTIATTTTLPTEVVEIYLVVAGFQIRKVERVLRKGVSPAEVVANIADLSLDEALAGAVTVISSSLVETVRVRAGVAEVDLSPAFTDLLPSEQRLAQAQVVFTLTARPGIGQVGFRINGRQVEVALPDGQLVNGPVVRENYAAEVLETPTSTTSVPTTSTSLATRTGATSTLPRP